MEANYFKGKYKTMTIKTTEYDDANNTQLDYINSRLKEYYDGDGHLLILELQNGEKILGITDIEDPTIVALAVHIVEQQEIESGSMSVYYRFYTYQNMADTVSELVLFQYPSIAYAPKQDIITAYFKYWTSIVNNALQYDDSETETVKFVCTSTKLS